MVVVVDVLAPVHVADVLYVYVVYEDDGGVAHRIWYDELAPVAMQPTVVWWREACVGRVVEGGVCGRGQLRGVGGCDRGKAHALGPYSTKSVAFEHDASK